MVESNLFTIGHEASFPSFFLGIANSFFLALPCSPPLLFCLRTLVCQGIRAGLTCYAAASLGQTVFFGCIFGGAYSIVQLWYDSEPFLYIGGCIVTFQWLCSMFQETKKIPEAILIPGIFALMLCNPPQLFQVTRLTTSLEGGNVWYLVGIFFGMFSFSSLFGITLATLFQTKKYRMNSCIIFCTASLLIASTSQYTWRVFLQYPLDMASHLSTSVGLPIGPSFQRTFQFFVKLSTIGILGKVVFVDMRLTQNIQMQTNCQN